MEPKVKNIVICSDGTGNSTIKGRGTNVFKLFEAVDVNGHRSDPELRRQLAFYDDGVGTEALKWVRIFAGATGYGLSRNVKQLYRELCRVYEPGDDIYLFGFSRGAFTVRTLSGLISDCGILRVADYPTEDAFRSKVRAAYKAYRRKYRAWLAQLFAWRRTMKGDAFKALYAHKEDRAQPIRFLGVWDTVDAVGLPFKLADAWNRVIWQYKFDTSRLCGAVQRGCHALALDEERGAFKPVIWDERDAETRARVEQVWFAGAHSNVGGGYPQHGMSLVALDWMMTKAELDGLRFVAPIRTMYATDHSFADKLYDPRSGLGMFYQWKPRHVATLCARLGIDLPKVHVSAVERIVQAPEGYAPGNLPPALQVATTERFPQIRPSEISTAVARAHQSTGDLSLSQTRAARTWVRIGLLSYFAFIIGLGGAVARMLALMLVSPFRDVRAFLDSALAVVTSFPMGLVRTWWQDPVAVGLLLIGLGFGWALSTWSGRRINAIYTSFWHVHREALRTALRRSPPVTAPSEQIAS